MDSPYVLIFRTKESRDAPILYDDLPVLIHALLKVIQIVEPPSRLDSTLRFAVALDPVYRLSKIETPTSAAP
jgi:hypothetical protein